MIDPKALLDDLRRQVKYLEADLKQTGAAEADAALREEWQEARKAGRTAALFEQWLPERVTQVAVAWILATVFVRFCEDNGLLEHPFIAGPGERLAQARELQQTFIERDPSRDYSHWLRAAFGAMSVSPVAAGLFDVVHNPMWSIKPTPYALKDLVEFWRTVNENGILVHDFEDETWNTRFLGDLYERLSDEIREKYALLQTPEFVEEFILKYTLKPAIAEFGLEPEPPYGREDLPKRLRVIDPTCGSGHFLLGAFHILLAAWRDQTGDIDKWTLTSRALESIHGVDKNPYAVAIARFRLLLAAMQSAEITKLSTGIDFSLNIAVGDSLIHGEGGHGAQGEFNIFGGQTAYTYHTEDIDVYIKSVDMLASGSYHAVVGNPPYITVSDKKEDAIYRKGYPSCHKEYSLAVPFAERFFKLATLGALSGFGAGYVGQITANSFMKREFGQKLIRQFFPLVDLTHVIDTSGAYIPSHGTPTVILLGRRRFPRASVVRTVRSVNGEPGIPSEPPRGLVWSEIVAQLDHPGFKGRWVSVDDLERSRYFDRFPWILESGGLELVELIGSDGAKKVSAIVYRVGYYGDSHADQAFIIPSSIRFETIANEIFGHRFHRGQQIRNWRQESSELAILPYDHEKVILPENALTREFLLLFWPLRTELWNRMDFSGRTYLAAGRSWWEWHQLPRDTSGHEWVLAFSDLSTHNHFALNASSDVYNRHAPIIRLKENASQVDYLGLMAILNSSTACFWLKQMSQNKGNGGIGGGIGDEAWEPRYEFTTATVGQFPLTSVLPLEFGRELDELGQRLTTVEATAVCADGVPSRDELDVARTSHEQILGRMITLQEELDWDVYHRYGLITDDESAELVTAPGFVPDIRLGERAFEIVMARQREAGELETQWFARHRSTPVTEIPEGWPEEYRTVVAKRIEFIERSRNIGLIERPECKRRWQSDPWDVKEKAALRTWLMNQCERRSSWYGSDGQPRAMTVNRLADLLRPDADVVFVARLYAGQDADLFDVLNEIIADEHVPFLAVYRYKGEGLLKRTLWEQTWEKQREEDRSGMRLHIDVPLKYTSADFRKTSYWRHRGKLDVPKERFISYPDASPGSDDSLLLGWAGWDHREQALALTTLIEQRSTVDGWDTGRLTPLLAGLTEVMPWVRQWHGEIDPAFGQSPADALDDYLSHQRESRSLTKEALLTWSPTPAVRRGTRRSG